ncbi:hypothetical protein H1R20_g8056, partial [Candolleomyces eurysporus]
MNHIALNARPHDAFNQMANTSSMTTPTTKRSFNAIVPLDSAPPVDIAAAFGSSNPTNGTTGQSGSFVPQTDPPPPPKKPRAAKAKSPTTPKKLASPTMPKSTRSTCKVKNALPPLISGNDEEGEEADDADNAAVLEM